MPPSDHYRITFVDVVDTSRPDLPAQTHTVDVDIVPFSPWNWLGNDVGYEFSIISDGVDTPVPENSKCFFRFDYPDIFYATEIYVSISLWWDGFSVLAPTAVPIEATSHCTVGQLIIERL